MLQTRDPIFQKPKRTTCPESDVGNTAQHNLSRKGGGSGHSAGDFVICPQCEGSGVSFDSAAQDELTCPLCDGAGDLPADTQAGDIELF